jgi:hypothetical protein
MVALPAPQPAALAAPAPSPAPAEGARPAPVRPRGGPDEAAPATAKPADFGKPAPRPIDPAQRQPGPARNVAAPAPAEQPEPFGRPPAAFAPASGTAAPKITASPPVEKRRKPGNGEGRGWVADLLRRASSAEEKEPAAPPPEPQAQEAAASGKRSPAQVVESLNSLSIDIARAIDHEASVELWDRYKRGERNVFTRRLYTLQGQRTFDELRRKYERDGDFRQAVDNYINDFERLLAQVSKDDTDPAVGRMYLTSDTGKVYTMLAHAAGRLS